MHAARRELAAVGVERELPVECDACATLDERPRLAVAAEPEGLEPGKGEEGEAVVQLRQVDVVRRQVGADSDISAAASDDAILG